MSRRGWTIIPKDWVQLERIINELGHRVLNDFSSLSDLIVDITAVSQAIISDETVLSDATAALSNDLIIIDGGTATNPI